MKWPFRHWLSRLITRGGLLWLCLLGSLAVDTRSALASCGDYLHHDGGSGDPMLAHNPLSSPSAPGPRCHGPHCQQDRQAPVAPNKAIEIPTFSDAILTSITSIVGADGLSILPCIQAAAVEGPGGRIFRPPRVA